MEIVVSFLLSLVFGLFWLWWYYRQDIWEKEPKRFVALIFILSMPLSALAGLFEYTIDQAGGGLSEHYGFLIASLFYVAVVAVVEEFAKFFVVFTVAYPNRAFNEPMDGIVYTAAAALGFASFENMFYVLDRGPFVLLLRGPVSTLGHVLFSALWGAALGLAIKEPSRARRRRMIGSGLLLSILAHGTYNILISLSHPFFGSGLEWTALSGIPFLAILYIIVSRKISYALKVSDFRPLDPIPSVASTPIPHYAPNPNRYQFPSSTASSSTSQTQDCPNCGRPNLVDIKNGDCYNCGSALSPNSKS